MAGATSVTQLMHAFGDAGTNVAEGYPRFAFTPSQRVIVDRLPEMMLAAQRTPFAALEANAQWALLLGLGQRTAPIGTGRTMSYYAAGVAIDIVGRALAARTGTVGVIHPTLDCLPAIIHSRGPRVVPVSEPRLRRRDPLAGLEPIGGLYVAIPNNPTGSVLDPDQLRRLAESCARRNVALAIDACFRAFDVEAQYDMYEVLDETGVDYVVIEDTGKLWPLGGVRLAFLLWAENSTLGIADASADLLMNAPPFSALVVEAFARDMADGGLRVIHDRLVRNREILHEALAGSMAELADGRSRVSMSLVRMPDGLPSTRLWGRLLRRSVHAVPGRPIWWARPRDGERYLRLALAREPEVIATAARELRAELDAST